MGGKRKGRGPTSSVGECCESNMHLTDTPGLLTKAKLQSPEKRGSSSALILKFPALPRELDPEC